MKTHLSCHELPKSLWKRYSSNNENHYSWIHKTAVIKSNKTSSYDTKYNYTVIVTNYYKI